MIYFAIYCKDTLASLFYASSTLRKSCSALFSLVSMVATPLYSTREIQTIKPHSQIKGVGEEFTLILQDFQ